MKEHPTLLDSLVAEFNNPAYNRLGFDVRALQKTLLSARRFVLDDEMSAFSTDLAYAPFDRYRDREAKDGGVMLVVKPGSTFDTTIKVAMEDLRRLARLPHSTMWIELNMRARIKRAMEAYSIGHRNDGPRKIGWLLMQHPQIDTAFMALECVSDTVKKDNYNELQPIPSCSIIAYQWRADELGPLGWTKFDHSSVPKNPEGPLIGLMSYTSEFAGIAATPFLRPGLKLEDVVPPHQIRSCFTELASDLRYLWALLAAINDVPVGYETVRPSKGYVSRGIYKKYLEHTVIHLKVPHRVALKVLAEQVISSARRRAHQVRGHFRRNFRKPGERIWIKKHQRGDARLGFVTHDYHVEHEPSAEPPVPGKAALDMIDQMVTDAMGEISKWPKSPDPEK